MIPRKKIIKKWTKTSDSPGNPMLKQICFDALDYAAFECGLLTRDKKTFFDGNNKIINVAPLTLIPTNFPMNKFEQAMNLQPVINKIIGNFSTFDDQVFKGGQ